MKKIFVVFVCILTTVAFLSSASAIDRSRKANNSDRKKEPTESKEIKEKKTSNRKPQTGTFSEKTIRKSETTEKVAPKKSEKIKEWFKTKKSKERYDYFIDKNNNGIDDRLEKDIKTKKVKERKVIKKKTPVPSEKAPAKVIPSAKAPQKIKGTKLSEQKKETKEEKTVKKRGRDKR